MQTALNGRGHLRGRGALFRNSYLLGTWDTRDTMELLKLFLALAVSLAPSHSQRDTCDSKFIVPF